MQTFINKAWDDNGRKRFYEATTVCFAVAADDAIGPDPANWQPTGEPVPANMDTLFVEAGIRYYGFL